MVCGSGFPKIRSRLFSVTITRMISFWDLYLWGSPISGSCHIISLYRLETILPTLQYRSLNNLSCAAGLCKLALGLRFKLRVSGSEVECHSLGCRVLGILRGWLPCSLKNCPQHFLNSRRTLVPAVLALGIRRFG